MILGKQLTLSHNLGAESFGIFSVVFLVSGLFQQLGGFGSQVYFSSRLVALKQENTEVIKRYRSSALLPFVLTSPILLFFSIAYFNYSFLAFAVFSVSILNALFIIQIAHYSIIENLKFCKIQAIKGLVFLVPLFYSFVVQDVNYILSCEIMTMLILNLIFFNQNLFCFDRYILNFANIKALLTKFGPAVYLSTLYGFALKVYISSNFTAKLIGVFFFTQILIMISQNIQYILSVLIGPIIKDNFGRLKSRIQLVVYFYFITLCLNSLLFFVLYFISGYVILLGEEYEAAFILLLPVTCVAVARASDVVGIIVMLLQRPIFVTIQQVVAICLLFSMLVFYSGAPSNNLNSISALIWFEFLSIFVAQLFVCLLLLLERPLMKVIGSD